jgi:hypothetical protein
MAKPPVSYGASVKLKAPESDPLPSVPTDPIAPALHAEEGAPASRRRPMETRSDPTILYLHPDGKYELKRYALARGPKVKVHDLLLEAVEEWAERHGIAAPFRVPPERPRRR